MKLNFKTFGEGEPIVFLHGLFGMLDNWNSFGKKVADAGNMVFLVDQRDHGRSPHTQDFSYELLAEDMYQFLTDQWLHRSVIVGHSMGGKVAMKFADMYPDMVEKLVVIDIAPRKYKGGHEHIFKALRGIDPGTYDDRQAIQDALAEDIHEPAVLHFLMKNISRKKEGGFEYKMNLPLLYDNYGKLMDELDLEHENQMPALFISGGQSNYVRAEDHAYILAHFPMAGFDVIPEAGHWVHADQPDQLFNKLMQFIQEPTS